MVFQQAIGEGVQYFSAIESIFFQEMVIVPFFFKEVFAVHTAVIDVKVLSFGDGLNIHDFIYNFYFYPTGQGLRPLTGLADGVD
jgi:hypothetical protein